MVCGRDTGQAAALRALISLGIYEEMHDVKNRTRSSFFLFFLANQPPLPLRNIQPNLYRARYILSSIKSQLFLIVLAGEMQETGLRITRAAVRALHR